MKTKLLRTFTLAASLSAILISLAALNWPKPEPCVLTVRPVESHARIATSIMRSGDTMRMVPDGLTHYWVEPLALPDGLSNVTFNLGVHFCVNTEAPECDIVMIRGYEMILPE